MKRIVALCLSIIFLFAFCGCTKQKDKENNSSATQGDLYNLYEYMKKGEFPEAKYSLGTAINTILNDSQGDDEEGHTHSTVYEQSYGVRSTFVDCGDFCYYYENGKRDLGVSSIVAQTKVFGFEMGVFTNKNDVIAAFPSYEYEERELSNSEMYFIPFEMTGCTAITYKVDNYRIDFIFDNNTLFAVNLVDTNNWTIT